MGEKEDIQMATYTYENIPNHKLTLENWKLKQQ